MNKPLKSVNVLHINFNKLILIQYLLLQLLHNPTSLEGVDFIRLTFTRQLIFREMLNKT
jgi:hypothetical protein